MRLELAPRKRGAPALTALVDIVFILLFFFMLAARTAPPRTLELRVEAPSSASAGASDVPEAIVRSGERVDYGGHDLAAGELVDRLRGAGVTRLSIRADGGARLQDLVTVLDALRQAGVAAQLLAAAP